MFGLIWVTYGTINWVSSKIFLLTSRQLQAYELLRNVLNMAKSTYILPMLCPSKQIHKCALSHKWQPYMGLKNMFLYVIRFYEWIFTFTCFTYILHMYEGLWAIGFRSLELSCVLYWYKDLTNLTLWMIT